MKRLTYCVTEKRYRCRQCGAHFTDRIPVNDELVRFDCGDGLPRFLPTYGEGGYLDWLKRLTDWEEPQPITVSVSEELMKKLSDRCPCRVSLWKRASAPECPRCHAKESTLESEQVKENTPLGWLEIIP